MLEPKRIENGGDQATSNNAASSTTRPISPLACLPDLCLLALLRQLPPADQMSARNTCHRWSVLVPAANRPHPRSLALIFDNYMVNATDSFNRLLHGRHFDWKLLQLLQKEDGSPLFTIRPLTEWNSLQFSTLDEETVSQIMATFPVVRELQLYATLKTNYKKRHCDCFVAIIHPTDLFVRLLEQWRPQLTNLILDVPFWCLNNGHLSSSHIDRLGATINSLSALKHLSTSLCSFVPNVRLLSQLTEFNTNSCLSQSSEIILRHFNPANSALTRISLGYHRVDTIASLSQDMRQRVIRFDNVCDSDYLRTICDHFPSLTSVRFYLQDTTLSYFFTHASRLTELVYLELTIDFLAIHPGNQSHRLLPQLKSVKVLNLIIKSLQSHRDLELLNLAWTMPNVQVIKFRIFQLRCTTCGIPWRHEAPTLDENKAKPCLRQMFAPLKRHCAHLRTIKHNLEKRLGTAEELLVEQPVVEAGIGVNRLGAQV